MSNEVAKNGEILLYSYDKDKVYVDVYFKDENFWMTQAGMAELFDCSSENVSVHLKNIYADEELIPAATAKKFLVVRKEGNRDIKRQIDYYSLDVIVA